MKNQNSIIPGLKYTDAPAAIDWLCSAFGFTKHLVVPMENGAIAHAQLVRNGAMIMIGSTGNGELDNYIKSPGDIRGINTQSAYMVVDEIDAHYKVALAAGAKVIIDIKDEEYGGRGYTCQDPQGVIWSFGTYNPWSED